MLKDTAMKWFDLDLDLGCSEAMLYACNEYYDLKLPEEVFLAASAFCGGMDHNEVCGALSGSLMVIGILYSSGRCHHSEEMKEIEGELFRRFTERLGSVNCDDLKEQGIKCSTLMTTASEILEDLIERHPVHNYAKAS